jgi:hypothetical protein
MRLQGWRVVLVALCAACSASAEQGWEGQIISLRLENDAVAKADRHYTQGSFLSYLSRDNAIPQWTVVLEESVPTFGYEVGATKWGFAVGQEIYTPEELESSELQIGDRPYAGWLFGRLTLQRRGPLSRRWSVLETFDLDLGIIGPESQAEDTQKVWHGNDPQGWRHQLKTEPGFALRYERRFQFKPAEDSDGWGVRLIPHVGGSAGNIATYLNAGGTVRFGYNVPDEFSTKAGGLKWGAYLLAGVDGRFVLHNIFLDGNTWRESHHVTKRPFVGDGRVGLGLVFQMVEISFAHVFRSREFNDQNRSDSFGSVSLAVKF